jgi:hypothetical protein
MYPTLTFRLLCFQLVYVIQLHVFEFLYSGLILLKSLSSRIQNIFRHMPVLMDFLYLTIVLEFINKLVSNWSETKQVPIIDSALFPSVGMSNFLTGLRFPNPDVHVIRCAKDPLGVEWESNSVHLLHSLSMVHFPRHAFLNWKNSNSFIERTTCEFPSRWAVGHWKYCLHMILMDTFSLDF